MGKHKIIEDYRKMLKKHSIDSKKSIAVVTCGLDSIIRSNTFVLNPPLVKKVTWEDTGGINLRHYGEYSDSKKAISLKKALTDITTWSSDLKFVASTFTNYLMASLINDNKDVPEINDVFFTRIIKTIRGLKTEYSGYHDTFCRKHKIEAHFPYMRNCSQVVSHIKNEMATVAKTNITTHFKSRALATLKWRFIDMFSEIQFQNDEHQSSYDWKDCTQEFTDKMFACLQYGDKETLDAMVDKLVKKWGLDVDQNALKTTFDADFAIFDKMMKVDPISRASKQQCAKTGEATSTERVSIDVALKKNTQAFLEYMHHSQQAIEELKLTKTYRSIIIESGNIVKTESKTVKELRAELWKKKWNWGSSKCPGFKLMPENKVANEFIRVDKRALKTLKLAHVYTFERVETKTEAVKEGCEEPKCVKVGEKGEGTLVFNDTIYTRLTQDGAKEVGGLEGQVIFVDKKTGKLMLVEEVAEKVYESDNNWWLDPALDVYSRKANVRQLRREKVFRSPKDFKMYTDLNPIDEWCPWIPGLSFQTDGVQVKLPICTVAKRCTRGLDMLVKKGYTGFPKAKDEEVTVLNSLSNGIYRVGRDNLVLDYQNAKDYIFLGIDPGVRRPYSFCVIDGANMPQDWSDVERIKEIDRSLDENKFMTCEEMEELRGTVKQRKHEKKRRVGTYAEGLKKFEATFSKTSLIARRSSYVEARLQSWYQIRKEMMHNVRSIYRFEAFRKGQHAMAYIAKHILGDVTKRAKKEGKKVAVVIGGAVYRQGGRGHSTMPKKSIIKELGIRVPTIILDEFRTSCINPFNFEGWKTVNDTDSRSGDRLRQCVTASRASSGSALLDRITAKERDRDAAGSVSIAQKGFYILTGNKIPHYDRGSSVV